MTLRKENYRDMERFIETRNAQRLRYYRKTQKYDKRPWEEEDVRLILESELTDRELSKLLERSMQSIQAKRHIVKREREGLQVG